MNMEPVQATAYPYADVELALSWRSGRARVVIALSLLAMLCATFQDGIALDRLHLTALHVWLPCLLAVLLAVAPDPVTRGGRLSKDAIALTAGLSCLLPNWQLLLIVCTPALLALGSIANARIERKQGVDHVS